MNKPKKIYKIEMFDFDPQTKVLYADTNYFRSRLGRRLPLNITVQGQEKRITFRYAGRQDEKIFWTNKAETNIMICLMNGYTYKTVGVKE